MCDVPSIAVFCSESVECFPVIIIIIIIITIIMIIIITPAIELSLRGSSPYTVIL
jgi:hypothetical protein